MFYRILFFTALALSIVSQSQGKSEGQERGGGIIEAMMQFPVKPGKPHSLNSDEYYRAKFFEGAAAASKEIESLASQDVHYLTHTRQVKSISALAPAFKDKYVSLMNSKVRIEVVLDLPFERAAENVPKLELISLSKTKLAMIEETYSSWVHPHLWKALAAHELLSLMGVENTDWYSTSFILANSIFSYFKIVECPATILESHHGKSQVLPAYIIQETPLQSPSLQISDLTPVKGATGYDTKETIFAFEKKASISVYRLLWNPFDVSTMVGGSPIVIARDSNTTWINKCALHLPPLAPE